MRGAPPRRVFGVAGDRTGSMPHHPVPRVEAVEFEDGGAVLRASFLRGSRLRVVRARRDGTLVSP